MGMNACGKQGDQVKSTGGGGKEDRDGGRRRRGVKPGEVLGR
jgi:hypothetical protein